MPESVEIMAEIFGLLGHTTQVAYDGIMAISIASWFSPQVVLLDLAMPGMNGIAVGKALRLMPNSRDAAIIAVTGFADEATTQAALEAGFDSVLKKPADREQLLTTIQRVLHDRRRRAEAETFLMMDQSSRLML